MLVPRSVSFQECLFQDPLWPTFDKNSHEVLSEWNGEKPIHFRGPDQIHATRREKLKFKTREPTKTKKNKGLSNTIQTMLNKMRVQQIQEKATGSPVCYLENMECIPWFLWGGNGCWLG